MIAYVISFAFIFFIAVVLYFRSLSPKRRGIVMVHYGSVEYPNDRMKAVFHINNNETYLGTLTVDEATNDVELITIEGKVTEIKHAGRKI